jgi:hypothetical protein
MIVFFASILASVRIPPILPPTLQESGYCCVSFQYNDEGNATEVDAYFCTHNILYDPAEASVRRWKQFPDYHLDPHNLDLSPEIQSTKISWRLQEEDGTIIYEPTKYLPKGEENGDGYRDYICDGTPIAPTHSRFPRQ